MVKSSQGHFHDTEHCGFGSNILWYYMNLLLCYVHLVPLIQNNKHKHSTLSLLDYLFFSEILEIVLLISVPHLFIEYKSVAYPSNLPNILRVCLKRLQDSQCFHGNGSHVISFRTKSQWWRWRSITLQMILSFCCRIYGAMLTVRLWQSRDSRLLIGWMLRKRLTLNLSRCAERLTVA